MEEESSSFLCKYCMSIRRFWYLRKEAWENEGPSVLGNLERVFDFVCFCDLLACYCLVRLVLLFALDILVVDTRLELYTGFLRFGNTPV